MSDSDDNATTAVEGTGEAGQPQMNADPMSRVHAHPRARVRPTTEEFRQYGAVGGGCSGCPFATAVEEAHDDPEERHFDCGLLGRRVWGEDSPCQTADWFDFIVEAWDDETRVGQAQLDLATAVIREGAQLTRFYERSHLAKLERWGPGSGGLALGSPEAIDTKAKADRNAHMAARFEAWLRGEDRLPLPAPSIPGLNPADAARHYSEEVAARVGLGVDHASFNREAAQLDQVGEDEGCHDACEPPVFEVPGEDMVVSHAIEFPGVTSLETARRQADARRSNLRPVTDGALADPVIVEGLLAAAGMLDATDPDAAPVRLQGVADLVAFRLNTGDPRFDPSKPVCVNGFLFHPATKD